MENVYPYVRSIRQPSALAKGAWQAGKPKGVTVHYSAERSLEKTCDAMLRTKVGYHILIDRQGQLHQTAYFTNRVDHAGKAMWEGLSPNRNHVAVALLSWGELVVDGDSLRTWTGLKLPKNEAARRHANNGVLAWWDAATAEQESALQKFLWWCMTSGIEPHHICGHDECALPAGRKPDPGGVLSQTMAELRERLALTR